MSKPQARNWQLAMPTVESYWINRIFYDVHHKPNDLLRYREDPMQYMNEVPLPESVKHLIRDNEIGALYLAGANPYLLRAHCLGLHLPEAEFLRSLRAAGLNAEAEHG